MHKIFQGSDRKLPAVSERTQGGEFKNTCPYPAVHGKVGNSRYFLSLALYQLPQEVSLDISEDEC